MFNIGYSSWICTLRPSIHNEHDENQRHAHMQLSNYASFEPDCNGRQTGTQVDRVLLNGESSVKLLCTLSPPKQYIRMHSFIMSVSAYPCNIMKNEMTSDRYISSEKAPTPFPVYPQLELLAVHTQPPDKEKTSRQMTAKHQTQNQKQQQRLRKG
ncbi:hypothetical protein ASPFODRAFT_29916 [Aspergillus luchuensis CBS 106.47]|uniref:Uncharacterized protein n=1 Tax=Aspergillus luchuensis (strain CBS 106.47) TaxID=1137211 RepID=A0A1M3TPX6_ASPLC|nr:hypothetical protein ASPFODRAFT_29916 [Aspergillus luchuensis CBS 106.47]